MTKVRLRKTLETWLLRSGSAEVIIGGSVFHRGVMLLQAGCACCGTILVHIAYDAKEKVLITYYAPGVYFDSPEMGLIFTQGIVCKFAFLAGEGLI